LIRQTLTIGLNNSQQIF